ncbi:hypothetical protein ACH5RR_018363 [Cinchona calisaya]|uniref:Uncharacterized protein n=1 Tax=Cinchona calisaya TaxID=153742 RepID=A0ABD2ZL68_9GENT
MANSSIHSIILKPIRDDQYCMFWVKGNLRLPIKEEKDVMDMFASEDKKLPQQQPCLDDDGFQVSCLEDTHLKLGISFYSSDISNKIGSFGKVLSFSGSIYTWDGVRNGRTIFRHLDRLLVNHQWIDMHPSSHVTHLTKTISDHSQLLLEIEAMSRQVPKLFRFQQMWLEHPTFFEEMRDKWKLLVEDFGMRVLVEQLKRLKGHLHLLN